MNLQISIVPKNVTSDRAKEFHYEMCTLLFTEAFAFQKRSAAQNATAQGRSLW